MAQDLTGRQFVADDVARIFIKRQNSPVSIDNLSGRRRTQRPILPFRSVNLPDRPGYDSGLQRHHLLPRQLLSKCCFGTLFDEIGREWPGLDDFRSNGMLLPSSDATALRIGLPLHRGPHRNYNAMVIERVGQVEAHWSSARLRTPAAAHGDAVASLQLLQRALRRRLLDPGSKRLALNRHDPLGQPEDFTHIDAMVDRLWPASDPWAAAPGFAEPNDTRWAAVVAGKPYQNKRFGTLRELTETHKAPSDQSATFVPSILRQSVNLAAWA